MLHKVLKIVSLIICVLAGIWLIRIMLAGDIAIDGSPELQSSLVTPLIYMSYLIFAIALVFVVVFVVKNLLSSGESIKSTLIGLGAFLGVLLISYVLASGEETPMRDGEVLSAGGSKLVEAGIYAFYILAVIAVGAMVFSGIKKLAK